ncbi:Protein HOTHEAD, partial [Mucuna pruriens]
MGWVLEQFIRAFLVGCMFLSGLSYFDKVSLWNSLISWYVCVDAASKYTFVREATFAPAISSYDYIVIGGGSCGCPLAATLSQGARVLVLERGGSPYTNPEQINMKNFVNTLSEISPSSFSQPFISRDGVLNSRARVLGGGSVLNAGFYSRASSSYIRESGWNESLAMDSYEWVEEKLVFEPPMMQWQSAVRDGLLEVGVLPYNGFTFDHLYGTKVGGTIFDKDGNRHTAADLFEYADPKRISVYLHATVHKILFKYNTEKRRPQAYGVIFKDAFGVMHRAYLSKKPRNEIILSAGAIGSPQLLMLSGIGPANHIEAHGIKVVLDQPLVGQGMADNPMNLLVVPSPVPVEVSLIETVGITNFGSFIETTSGLSLGHSWSERLQGIFEFVANQSGEAWTFSPEAEESIADTIRSLANPSLKGGIIIEKITGPRSTGHLEIISTNPNDNPSVTFNYFQDPEDLRICVQGMKTIIDLINSKAFSKFRYHNMPVQALIDLMLHIPMNLRPKHANAAFSLEQYCIDTVLTIWHYHGGCQSGKVVDHNYKVIGVEALRVIDGSTFSRSPGTNPQATIMMLGRYMGEKIIRKRFFRGRKKNKDKDKKATRISSQGIHSITLKHMLIGTGLCHFYEEDICIRSKIRQTRKETAEKGYPIIHQKKKVKF